MSGKSPPPPPKPPPPVTQNSAEVSQAGADQRRKTLRQYDFSKTIIAGRPAGGMDNTRNTLGS